MTNEEHDGIMGWTKNPLAYSDEEAEALRSQYKKLNRFYKTLFYVTFIYLVFCIISAVASRGGMSAAYEVSKAVLITAVTFVAIYRKERKTNLIAALVWFLSPLVGIESSSMKILMFRFTCWLVGNIPMALIYIYGIKKNNEYFDLSKKPGFPYFTCRSSEKYINNYAPPPRPESKQWIGDYDGAPVKEVIRDVEVAYRANKQEKEERRRFKEEHPDIETRTELRTQMDGISLFFNIPMVWHIFLMAISVVRLMLSLIAAIASAMVALAGGELNLSTITVTSGEMLAAFLFAVTSVLATYKNPYVVGINAVLWLAFPRFCGWSELLEGGGYIAAYIIFNVLSAAYYFYGIKLAKRWRVLKAMPDFPTFVKHPDINDEEIKLEAEQKKIDDYKRRVHVIDVPEESKQGTMDEAEYEEYEEYDGTVLETGERPEERKMDLIDYSGGEELPDHDTMVKNVDSADSDEEKALKDMGFVDLAEAGEIPDYETYIKETRGRSKHRTQMGGVEYKNDGTMRERKLYE